MSRRHEPTPTALHRTSLTGCYDFRMDDAHYEVAYSFASDGARIPRRVWNKLEPAQHSRLLSAFGEKVEPKRRGSRKSGSSPRVLGTNPRALRGSQYRVKPEPIKADGIVRPRSWWLSRQRRLMRQPGWSRKSAFGYVYAEYLRSPQWQEVRRAYRLDRAWVCSEFLCMQTDALQLHHKHYRNLFEEQDHLDCLEPRCRPHHCDEQHPWKKRRVA